MQYYLFPTIALLAFILENSKIKGAQNANRVLLAFLIVAAILFVSLRAEGIGTDYYAYRGLFIDPHGFQIEPGFSLLVGFVKVIGGGFQLFIGLFFTFSILLKVFVFEKLSYSISISLMVSFGFWFLVYDMNGIRQGLSIAIVGIAAYHAYKANSKCFLFFTVLAGLIHYTSLFFLPFYYVLKLELSKKKMTLLLSLLFVLAYFGFSELFFSNILGLSVDSYFIDKVSSYSEMVEYNTNILFSFNFIHRLLILCITFFMIDYIPIDTKLKRFFLTAAFMNISIFLFFSRFELIATRGSLSYRFVECIFFSYLPFAFKESYAKYIVAFIIYLYIIFQIYVTLKVPDGNLIPYKSILF